MSVALKFAFFWGVKLSIHNSASSCQPQQCRKLRCPNQESEKFLLCCIEILRRVHQRLQIVYDTDILLKLVLPRMNKTCSQTVLVLIHSAATKETSMPRFLPKQAAGPKKAENSNPEVKDYHSCVAREKLPEE